MAKRLYVLLHIAFWGYFIISSTYDMYTGSGHFLGPPDAQSAPMRVWYAFIFSFGYQAVFMTGFYGFYFFVGPAFFTKKYLRGLLYILATFAAVVLVRYIFEFGVFLPYLKFNNYPHGPVSAGYYIRNCIMVSLNHCMFGIVVYFIVSTNRSEKEKRELEKEKIKAELSFLKTQVNPHFLFNTINDVYALTYQKNDDAPEALLKLSGLLRYMLDSSDLDKVPLEKEINYLENYLALQNIGAKKNLCIDFAVSGNADGLYIAPLLLIPFMENIIKHGVVDDPLDMAELIITITNNTLVLSSSNKIKKQQKDNTGGIGLKNTQRRLQLLYYGKHNFTLKEDGGVFTCLLKIDLSETKTKYNK